MLLLCFVVAMLVNAVVLHIGVVSVTHLMGEPGHWLIPSVPAIALITIAWTAILCGAAFRAYDVSAGGVTLATRFGAVPANSRHRNANEKQLFNVVDEMAIASGCPAPDVYILPHETSINAMVLGPQNGSDITASTVLVVTRGALEHLDRDELKAVVAHEFGHIANGDIPVNMRLLITLSGMMALYEVGRLLVGDNPRDLFHPGVLVGYLLITLSSIGVLLGLVIRGAFSRQREYLADASAAQFTRNPNALASALSVIEQQHQPALHSIYTQELMHVCFQSGRGLGGFSPGRFSPGWFNRLLASHPPVHKRIQAINPLFLRAQDRIRRHERHSKTLHQPATHSVTNPVMRSLTQPVTIEATQPATPLALCHVTGLPATGLPATGLPVTGLTVIGLPVTDAMTDTSVSDHPFLAAIADIWISPEDCSTLLHALLLIHHQAPDTHKDSVPFHIDSDDGQSTDTLNERIQQSIAQYGHEFKQHYITLAHHATAVLVKSTGMEYRHQLAKSLSSLVRDKPGVGTLNLVQYAKLHIILNSLVPNESRPRNVPPFTINPRRSSTLSPDSVIDYPVKSPAVEKSTTTVQSFESMADDFAVLLSWVVTSSGAPTEQLDREFERVLSCYTGRKQKRRDISESTEQVATAFQTLRAQPLAVRQAFVQHCLEIVAVDGNITASEHMTIELFAISLDCCVQAA